MFTLRQAMLAWFMILLGAVGARADAEVRRKTLLSLPNAGPSWTLDAESYLTTSTIFEFSDPTTRKPIIHVEEDRDQCSHGSYFSITLYTTPGSRPSRVEAFIPVTGSQKCALFDALNKEIQEMMSYRCRYELTIGVQTLNEWPIAHVNYPVLVGIEEICGSNAGFKPFPTEAMSKIYDRHDTTFINGGTPVCLTANQDPYPCGGSVQDVRNPGSGSPGAGSVNIGQPLRSCFIDKRMIDSQRFRLILIDWLGQERGSSGIMFNGASFVGQERDSLERQGSAIGCTSVR